jgi:hypothetical protein
LRDGLPEHSIFPCRPGPRLSRVSNLTSQQQSRGRTTVVVFISAEWPDSKSARAWQTSMALCKRARPVCSLETGSRLRPFEPMRMMRAQNKQKIAILRGTPADVYRGDKNSHDYHRTARDLSQSVIGSRCNLLLLHSERFGIKQSHENSYSFSLNRRMLEIRNRFPHPAVDEEQRRQYLC